MLLLLKFSSLTLCDVIKPHWDIAGHGKTFDHEWTWLIFFIPPSLQDCGSLIVFTLVNKLEEEQMVGS